jgi:hypothetical protein
MTASARSKEFQIYVVRCKLAGLEYIAVKYLTVMHVWSAVKGVCDATSVPNFIS